MVKGKGKVKGVELIVLTAFAIIIASLSFVSSATYTIGKENHSITKEYGLNGLISGWINLSFNKQPTDLVFTALIDDGDELEKEITLAQLLKRKSNANFAKTCVPIDCNPNYDSEGAGYETQTIALTEDESKVIGFMIDEDAKLVSDITSFNLNISSNNLESGSIPLEIDILNDDKTEWQAYKAGTSYGIKNYSCYEDDEAEGNDEAEIEHYDELCEKIEIGTASTIKIGANIIGTEAIAFTMRVERISDDAEADCTATAVAGSGAEQEISCVIDNEDIKFSEKEDYLVCIRAKLRAGEKKYTIKNEDHKPCGYNEADYSGEYTADYKIFAQLAKYAPIGNFVLNNTESEKSLGEEIDIEEEVKTYLSERYANNCSKGCYIPIKLTSGIAQSVTINGTLKYKTGSTGKTEDTIYEFTEAPAIITSSFQKLYLDEAGFLTPREEGEYEFLMRVATKKIFEEEISVKEVSTTEYITPKQTAVKYPTTFRYVLSDYTNITKYKWDFGNGDNKTTTTNEIYYTYNLVGDYTLTAIAMYLNGKRNVSKTALISVEPASVMVPALLEEAEENLNATKLQIAGAVFSQFEKDSITASLKLDLFESTLTTLKAKLATTTTEAGYETMVSQLIEFKIPESVQKTDVGEGLDFYPSATAIDISVLRAISEDAGSGNEAGYKDAVLAWQDENVDVKLSFVEISAVYGDYNEPAVKVYNITITKNTGSGTSYLIIKKMDGLMFDKTYETTEESGYVYIPLGSAKENVVFSTKENVDFTTLPVFVAPKISELALIETDTGASPFTSDGSNKWFAFGVIAFLVVIIGGVAGVVIFLWYKRKYESHLFSDKTNLINLLNYIDDAKKKGITIKEITARLKKSGWSSEQITYALKKHSSGSK